MDGNKLKKIRFDNNLTQDDLGGILGVTRSYISLVEKNKTKLSAEKINILEKKFNFSLQNESNDDGCLYLPFLTASAGGGYSLIEAEKIAVPKAELISVIKNGFEKLAVVKISGNSMAPTFNDGDILIVDMAAKEVEDNRVYVLNYGGELFCKRILKGLTYMMIESDNPKYPPERIQGQELEKLNIVGKVAYRMNKVYQ